MVRYSHSKVSTFEQCPYKYKLKYIDKIKPDIPATIEAFMGSLVHKALEAIYQMQGKLFGPSKDGILKFYNNLWEKEYSDDILVVKNHRTVEDYRNAGAKFISDYYDKHHPFDKLQVLGLETQDMMELPDGSYWHVRIDLFAKDEEGNYYVIDHKTNSRMKTQWEADEDKQLAMYSLWVRKKFKDAKSVKLVWNMLAHNSEVVSEPTEKRLEELQEEVLVKIAKIKHAKHFPPRISHLCHYCEYQNICPYFQRTKRNGERFTSDYRSN